MAFDREQHEELLRDLAEIVLERSDEEEEETSRLDPDSETMFVQNLFVRLVASSEPVFAALASERSVAEDFPIHHYDDQSRSVAAATQPHLPGWLPDSASLQPGESVSDAFVAHLKVRNPALETDLLLIPHFPVTGVSSFILLAWPPGAEERRQYETARAHWALLLSTTTRARRAALSRRLFSMVAHNLGAPVFHLTSDARILADGYLEENDVERRLKYDQILRQSRHLQGIIDAILSLDKRDPVLNIKQVSLAELAYDVVRTIRQDARERRVRIDFPKPTAELARQTRFQTDEIRVYDILLNLLSNAVKYSPPDGVVHVRLRVSGHGAELRVSDQGPGIPPEEQRHIFQPFFRGRMKHHQVGGLGLGLYVVDMYTRALRGRVQITSESPHGTTFTVFLPQLPRQLHV
ncbi:MAG TPA: sensor histidine kinase [Thermoanaerobaculia bacterium]|nr:sensor histidine kinase [Thermoanaerobaculia bacterium]